MFWVRLCINQIGIGISENFVFFGVGGLEGAVAPRGKLLQSLDNG